MEGLGAPWRVAEARALAARVGRLLADGTPARDVVLLTRATTDLRVYERALEDRGIPTYVIGGRGYWSHPQVIDVVSYLEAIANPRAEEALYTVLASPLVGVSADALVVLAATARDRRTDPWSVLREPDGAFEAFEWWDRDLLARFADWFAIERTAAARAGIEELIDRAVERTGYDLAVLAMPGGPAAARQRPQADAAGARARGRPRAGSPRVPGSRRQPRPAGLRRRRGARERGAGRGRGARRRAADDDPPRQGARVRGRMRRRPRPRASLAGRCDPGRPRRPLRDASGRTRHRPARVGARLQGARRRAVRGRGAGGAPAVLRGDDPRPRAADPERCGQAREVAGARGQRRRWRPDRVDRAGGRAAGRRRGDVRASRGPGGGGGRSSR